MYNIRIAKTEDLENIFAIYNQAVKSKFETADTVEVDFRDRSEWLNNHNPDTHPIIVYENNGEIKGWVSISPYRNGRKALRYTVEISYYIHNDYKRQGIGGKLVEYAIQVCKKNNYKTLVAIVLDKNEASIGLLAKFGFVKWGHLPKVADFDGVECGHVYYGLKI